MDCKAMKDIILTDYIDGRLTGEALKDVESHIASCDRCHGLVSGLASMRAIFVKTGHKAPPAGVWDAIRAEIKTPLERNNLAFDIFANFRTFGLRFRPAGFAIATIAIIAVALVALRLMPQSGTIRTTDEQDEILSLASIDANGNGTDYSLGTPEEEYFL